MEKEQCFKGSQEMEGQGDSISINIGIQDGMKDDKRDSSYQQGCVSEIGGDGVPSVLDFDLLCATVAMQSNRMSFELRNLLDKEGFNGGGVQRMWEGGLMECHDDRDLCLRTAFMPFTTFGRNMGLAGFGSCFVQGAVHFVFGLFGLVSLISYGVTGSYGLLYLAIASFLLMAAYAGYFRSQMRSRFNIKGRDSPFDDCLHHLFCSSCALCQEARTLEINNVQEGVWHGRGDILVGGFREPKSTSVELQNAAVLTISPEPCHMDRKEHSWIKASDQTEPLVDANCEKL